MHVVVALRADVGVGVGVLAGQLDVVALLAHQLDKVLGQERRALIVVGDDLGSGDAFLRDLTVDQEAGDARILGLLHRRHRRIRAGVVQDDRRRLAGDTGLEQFHLLVGIVVVDQLQHFVAQLLGFGGGDLGHRAKERVLDRRHDHADQFGAAGRRGGLGCRCSCGFSGCLGCSRGGSFGGCFSCGCSSGLSCRFSRGRSRSCFRSGFRGAAASVAAGVAPVRRAGADQHGDDDEQAKHLDDTSLDISFPPELGILLTALCVDIEQGRG